MEPKAILSTGRSALWLRRGGRLGFILLFNSIVFGAAPVPTDKPSNYPRWWFEREVVQRVDPGNSAPVWSHHDYPGADDYAAANLGQLKQIASKAAAEMNGSLAGGAGADVNNLMAQWSMDPAANVTRDDFAILNLGQLKAVAKLFYDRLIAAQFTSTYPWAAGTADDYSTANIGQLKYLFSFDLTIDSDGDGIPNWWEILYGLNPNDPTDAGQLSQNGQFTNLQEYLLGLNPASADSDGDGIPDVMEIANGTNPTRKDAPAVQLQVRGFTAP